MGWWLLFGAFVAGAEAPALSEPNPGALSPQAIERAGRIAEVAPAPPPAITLTTGDLVQGAPATRRVDDDASLVVFVAGEHRGALGPCGCEGAPRGGFARLTTLLRSAASDDPHPQLRLYGGSWADDRRGFDDALLPEARALDQRALQALVETSFDAVNVSHRDLAYVTAVGWAQPSLVATNLAPNDDRVPPPRRFVRLERGGLRILVLGVSAPGRGVQGYHYTDPLEAIAEVIAAEGPQSDLVVVLSAEIGRKTKEIARTPGVDLLVETDGFKGREAPEVERKALWVKTLETSPEIAELRLWVSEGAITQAHVRAQDLEARLPEDKAVARLAREARTAARKARSKGAR